MNPEDSKKTDQLNNPEAEVEKAVDEILENTECRKFNFLINASNQANHADTYNMSTHQVNALFILIHPYYLENIKFEELHIDIDMSETGNVTVNGQEFKALEVQPGVRVFGIIKKTEETTS